MTGVPEAGSNAENVIENDEGKVAKILHEIDCYVSVQKVARTGQNPDGVRCRPIKVTLHDVPSRTTVMKNSKKLKRC